MSAAADDAHGADNTLVFCMTRCLGESINATSDVENSISMRATLPSSSEKILEKGSVWYMRKPLDVPVYVSLARAYQRFKEYPHRRPGSYSPD
jgi:hypothetical protein